VLAVNRQPVPEDTMRQRDQEAVVRSFELVVNGKTYHVEIGDTSGQPIEVLVDGTAYLVETIGSDSSAAPATAPTAIAVPRKPAAAPPARRAPVSRTGTAEGTKITAPMPGKILSIKVSAGDQVENEQVVCTLEAMKMEMAINATTSGTIVQVNVEPGQTVNHGDTLCVIG
jgi:biotin carboxyl carrier protein